MPIVPLSCPMTLIDLPCTSPLYPQLDRGLPGTGVMSRSPIIIPPALAQHLRNTLNWLVRSCTVPKERQKLTVNLLCVSAEAYCVVSALQSSNGHLYLATQGTLLFSSQYPRNRNTIWLAFEIPNWNARAT